MLSLAYDIALVAVGFFAGDYMRKNFPGMYQDLLTKGNMLASKALNFFKRS